MGEPGGPIPDAGMPEGKRQPRRVAQVRSARSVVCRITLLDGTLFQTDVDKRAFGQILFDKTCDNLDLLEKDYFGLSYIDPATKLRNWLNNEKKISKQMKGLAWEFNFEVKFYPSDPQQLHEDLTRYQLCLQIRNDIVSGKLPCSFVTYALLGSYTVQSELGDFEVEEFGPGTEYIRKMKFAPRQDRELLKKIADLHKTHRGQTPEEAELHFLENAKKLAMFGVDLSDARDGEGVEIQLGVCASGIIVFREKLQINKFVWPKIVKMSYKRKKFYMKLRSGEFEDFQSLIAFKFAHVGLAKRLWKVCVENHAFFRNREPDSPSQRRGFLKLGSKFRYSGRTQFQTKQAMAAVDRPSPYFDRVLSKRATYHGRTPHKSLEDEFYRPRPEPRHHAPRVEEHFIDRKPPPVRKPVPEPEIMDEKRHSSEDEDEEEEEDEREEEPADRKSRMEKIHAVPTPLAAVMLGHKKEDHPVENNNVERPPPRRRSYDEDSMEKVPIEDDMERSRHEPRNTEPQPPLEQPPPPPSQTFDPPKLLSKEERKRREKEEKEMKRKQKEEEKRKKKEADREKKQKEKEKKKSKGKEKIGKEWQQAVAVAVTNEGEETVERKHIPKRMSSFEEQKHEEARRGSKSGSETEDRRDEERAPAADKGDNSSDKDEPRSNEASGHNSEQDDVEDDDKSNPNTSRVGEEFDL